MLTTSKTEPILEGSVPVSLRLKVDVANVYAGAHIIDAVKADIASISVPACDEAVGGLPGFATAAVLGDAAAAMRESLHVAGERYDDVARLIRGAADAYEQADSSGSPAPSLGDRARFGTPSSRSTASLNPTFV